MFFSSVPVKLLRLYFIRIPSLLCESSPLRLYDLFPTREEAPLLISEKPSDDIISQQARRRQYAGHTSGIAAKAHQSPSDRIYGGWRQKSNGFYKGPAALSRIRPPNRSFFTHIAPIGILQIFEAPEGRVLRNEAHSWQSEAHATAKSSVGRSSTLGFLWTYPCV